MARYLLPPSHLVDPSRVLSATSERGSAIRLGPVAGPGNVGTLQLWAEHVDPEVVPVALALSMEGGPIFADADIRAFPLSVYLLGDAAEIPEDVVARVSGRIALRGTKSAEWCATRSSRVSAVSSASPPLARRPIGCSP